MYGRFMAPGICWTEESERSRKQERREDGDRERDREKVRELER